MKGQADIIYLTAMLFVVIIAVFTVDIIWSGFQSNSAYQQIQNATPTGKLAAKSTQTSLNIINNSIVILYLMGAIASIILAAFAASSPIFLIPALIVLPIEVLFAFVFHDMFFAIMTNTMFSGLVVTYPLVFTLFQYLPIISFGFSIILIIVTFLK